MDCNSFRQYIDDYIDNDISNVVKHEMITHMNSCAECKKELEDMKKMVEYINSMPKISVPDDFMTNLTRRINLEDAHKIAYKEDRYKRIFNYRTYSAVAACILLFVIFKADVPGMLFSSRPKDATQQSINSVLSEDNIETAAYDGSRNIVAATPEITLAPVETPAADISAPLEVAAVEPIVTQAPAAPTPIPVTVQKKVTPAKTNKQTATKAVPKATAKPVANTKAAPTTVSGTAVAQEESIAAYSLDSAQETDNISINTNSANSVKASSGGGSGGGSSSVANAVTDSTSTATEKTTTYIVTIKNFNKQAAVTILSEVGASSSGGYYTIPTSKLGTLWSKFSTSNISYVKTATVIGNSDTAILYVYFK